MKSVNCSKPGDTSIICLKIKHIPYKLIFTAKFNDSLILITIISWDYVGDVTIPTQVIKYNQCCFRRIRLQYSHQIKLFQIVRPIMDIVLESFHVLIKDSGA